jgi:peroxiredoxin Q/BCP
MPRILVLALVLSACGSSSSSSSSGTTMPTVGSAAPDIMLQDQTGRVRTLAEYRGHPVVVYFYPRDATPGCTHEACAFRDAWDRLQATGTVVLGISADDVASHQHFHDDQHLPFDLLADPENTAAHAYGVPVHVGIEARVTFLVDRHGQIAHVYPDVDPAVHCDEVLTAIAALPAE